jgi:hypothetical protein
MKPRTSAVIAAAFLLAAAGAASAEEKHRTPQQEKLAHCAHESKGLKGDERHKFLSDCLKGHAEPEAEKKDHADASHGRMKSCNDDARRKDLHGDERRAFMSSCLKG